MKINIDFLNLSKIYSDFVIHAYLLQVGSPQRPQSVFTKTTKKIFVLFVLFFVFLVVKQLKIAFHLIVIMPLE